MPAVVAPPLTAPPLTARPHTAPPLPLPLLPLPSLPLPSLPLPSLPLSPLPSPPLLPLSPATPRMLPSHSLRHIAPYSLLPSLPQSIPFPHPNPLHLHPVRFHVEQHAKCVGHDLRQHTLVAASYAAVPTSHPHPFMLDISESAATHCTSPLHILARPLFTSLHIHADTPIHVTSPGGIHVYLKEGVSEGQLGFTAEESGEYHLCFWLNGHHVGRHDEARQQVEVAWREGQAASHMQQAATKERVEVGGCVCALAMPALAMPALAMPALAMPALAMPALAMPALAMPALAMPALAMPALAMPALAMPALAMPALAIPDSNASSQQFLLCDDAVL
ncbi:unnamed protein product [Closterium sp. Naga37s-1]|nr:unnamed protein product [Closterium sp. Naga37s-1]